MIGSNFGLCLWKWWKINFTNRILTLLTRPIRLRKQKTGKNRAVTIKQPFETIV